MLGTLHSARKQHFRVIGQEFSGYMNYRRNALRALMCLHAAGVSLVKVDAPGQGEKIPINLTLIPELFGNPKRVSTDAEPIPRCLICPREGDEIRAQFPAEGDTANRAMLVSSPLSIRNFGQGVRLNTNNDSSARRGYVFRHKLSFPYAEAGVQRIHVEIYERGGIASPRGRTHWTPFSVNPDFFSEDYHCL